MSQDDGGLRTLFHNNLRRVHWVPIESGLTGKGIPDDNGCCGGAEFWVEYKQTPEWAVTLKPEQVGWLMRRHRAGGRVFVAVRRHCQAGPRRPEADELYLFAGSLARELKDLGIRGSEPLHMSAGGPSRWGWDAVLEVLTR